jgi:outer membrane receptor protein involved in Fe transport
MLGERISRPALTLASAILSVMSSSNAIAAPEATQTAQSAASKDRIETVVVTGRAYDLTGVAQSANQGTVGAQDIALRPILRPGEIVENVPGVIITQHSGSGKANQYFLRGFNLDHGTDLAVSVEDVPVNMPSHAHGQGYADLNFLSPSLSRPSISRRALITPMWAISVRREHSISVTTTNCRPASYASKADSSVTGAD